MSRNTSSLPQPGTLLGVPATAGPATAIGRSVVPAGSASRRTASASSFLSQRLGDSFRFLPQPTGAATSKRTRHFLQNLASSSSLSSHEAQQVLTSATDSKVALLSGASASLRSDVGLVSDHRAVKQPKLATRPCVSTVNSSSLGTGDFFSASFTFGSNGPLGPQPEKITPPPIAFVPGLSRPRSQQTIGSDGSFVSKSILSSTSRNLPVSNRGTSPSPAPSLLNTKSMDGEKKGAGVETADAQVVESRAQPETVSLNTHMPPVRPRSEGACVDPRAPSLLPVRLDFLDLADCCRLIMCDTTEAFGDDFGVDNTHNSRLAQFSYDQAAYKADKAHPASDYTATSKRISPETRDLLMCILNQVAAHLAQNSSPGSGESGEKQEKDGKTTPGSDPLSPRAAATVAIAIQLFDRFMHVVHQNDLHYGLSAEHRMHPLHGVNVVSGNGQGRSVATMNNVLLNQMIAIACFCFADRVEAIHAYDYSAVLEAWKQQATGVLRQSWTSSSPLSSTVLKQKLMCIERKIISHVRPAGNVSVTPISELTEGLLNVAVQFAHVNERQQRRLPPLGAETTTPSREECLEGRQDGQLTTPGFGKSGNVSLSKLSSPFDCKRRASVSGEIGRASVDEKRDHRLSLSGRETAASSRRCSSVSLREGDETADETGSPSPSSPFALRLRISGSNEPDMARLIAQLLVRLGQLDRRICLSFKPSIVASAACQIALLPQLSATEISPLSPSGRLAATRAFIASGASTGCRLVRRCQSMLLHKWLKVRNAMDLLLSSFSYTQNGSLSSQHAPALTSSPGLSGSGCSLPDRMAAEWVLSRLTLSSHKKMLELLQFHAEIWAECAAANLKAKALAVGAPVNFIEAVTGAMSGGNNAGSAGKEVEKRVGERKEETQTDRRRARSLQPRVMGRVQRRGAEERGTQARASGLTTSVGLYAITALQKELKRAERASIEGRRLREHPSQGDNSNQENRVNA